MSMDDRRVFYKSTINFEGNIELDYLRTVINKMKLSTVAEMRMTAAYANRPDLVSLHSYGSYNYGWLISLHNKILNPFTEYNIGKVIKIPSLDDYYRFYNRNKFKSSSVPYTKTFTQPDYYNAIYSDEDGIIPPLTLIPLPPVEGETYPVTSINGMTGDVTLTKQDLILGNVKNFGIATEQQALEGTTNTAYMTPLRTKQLVDSVLGDLLDERLADIVIDEGTI